MKARVLQPFIMGTGKYEPGQIVDLSDDRIIRLIGEGLVQATVEQKTAQPSVPVSTPAVSASVADVPAGTAKKSQKKKR